MSRRKILVGAAASAAALGVAASARAASFGNPDAPPEGRITPPHPFIAVVKKSLGHYVQNTGDTDLVFLEVFRSSYFADVSLSDWLTHTPPEMVAQTLNVDPATIAKFPNNKPEIMPE